MKKILITGTNGLLGQKLVYRMAGRADIDLVATARGGNRLLLTEGYRYYDADVTDYEEIIAVINKEKPDCIIHTAAMTNVDACESQQQECRAANVDAVQNLCIQAQQHNIHLVHVSTDFIFDGKNGPYDETATPNPLSFYGQSKLDAEKAVMKLSTPWAILRTVLVYGITDNMSRSNIVLWVKNNLEAGKTIRVVDDQFRTPTFAEDLAQGCELAALQGATGIYNISGADFMSIYDLAVRVADHYKLDKNLIERSTSEGISQPAKRPLRTGFIIDKAVKELGYRPTPFEESLDEMDRQMKM
jgi:dTDP-4-dehydrorhamnose reductase